MKIIVGLNLLAVVSGILRNDEGCVSISGNFKACRESQTITRVMSEGFSSYLIFPLDSDTTIGANAFTNANLSVLRLNFPYPGKEKITPTLTLTFLPHSFSGMSELTNLTVTHANINFNCDNPFAGLLSLQSLEIMNSNLTEVPTEMLKSLPNLEELSLERNQIREIQPHDLAPFKRLRILNLSFNEMRNIAPGTFDGLDGLRVLDLSFNVFTAVPGLLKGLTQLEILRISKSFDHHGFQSFIFQDVPNLRKLQMGYNNLTALAPGIFDSIMSLRKLSLYGNQIRNIPTGIFERLRSLKEISIADNDLETIEPGAFGDLNLDGLILSLNRVSKIIQSDTFKGLTARRLSLNKCKISRIEPKAFGGLRVTQMLDLSENDLTDVGVEDFSGLTVEDLDLSQNPIETIAQNAFKNTVLQRLGLYGTPVKNRVDKNSWGIDSSVEIMK